MCNKPEALLDQLLQGLEGDSYIPVVLPGATSIEYRSTLMANKHL